MDEGRAGGGEGVTDFCYDDFRLVRHYQRHRAIDERSLFRTPHAPAFNWSQFYYPVAFWTACNGEVRGSNS
jgi:hypothetical protein